MLAALGISRRSILITKRSIEVPELGSKLEVLATDDRTVPGRSVSLLIIDEARDIPDDVYTALAPAVIGGQGKMLIASTAGRPVGFFYELVRAPPPETFVYHSTENQNLCARARADYVPQAPARADLAERGAPRARQRIRRERRRVPAGGSDRRGRR